MNTRPVKQVIVIRRDLSRRRGKEIAQGAHASSGWPAIRVTHAAMTGRAPSLTPAQRQWLADGWRKVTLQVRTEEELMELREKAVAAGLEPYLVTDAGHTEFAGVPTVTALAIGPDYDDLIDPITGGLTLY